MIEHEALRHVKGKQMEMTKIFVTESAAGRAVPASPVFPVVYADGPPTPPLWPRRLVLRRDRVGLLAGRDRSG